MPNFYLSEMIDLRINFLTFSKTLHVDKTNNLHLIIIKINKISKQNEYLSKNRNVILLTLSMAGCVATTEGNIPENKAGELHGEAL